MIAMKKKTLCALCDRPCPKGKVVCSPKCPMALGGLIKSVVRLMFKPDLTRTQEAFLRFVLVCDPVVENSKAKSFAICPDLVWEERVSRHS